ncbi:hypothetical protein GCM10009808_10890 [Microbacterium sediminicola]|uniref:UspA domain-containing protein n=1 Tax=Microbacterium sediminicola TaxID=415210 RepID=A0ABP4TZD0_9MICO
MRDSSGLTGPTTVLEAPTAMEHDISDHDTGEHLETFARLVVGVDGSGPSSGALSWALRYARAHGTPLLIVHIVDDTWGVAGDDYMAEAQQRGIHVLDAARAEARRHGVTAIQTELVHGRTPGVLAGAARTQDLLVVGSHRTGYLRGRSFGAASLYVVAAARSAVVVVPNLPVEGRHGVVVGVGAKTTGGDVLRRGAAEAASADEHLTLVHARTPLPHEDAAATGEIRSSAARDVLSRACALALREVPRLDVSTRVVAESVPAALLTAATDASLLVIGRGRAEAPPHVSAVVHDVLMNLNAPALVVP